MVFPDDLLASLPAVGQAARRASDIKTFVPQRWPPCSVWAGAHGWCSVMKDMLTKDFSQFLAFSLQFALGQWEILPFFLSCHHCIAVCDRPGIGPALPWWDSETCQALHTSIPRATPLTVVTEVNILLTFMFPTHLANTKWLVLDLRNWGPAVVRVIHRNRF